MQALKMFQPKLSGSQSEGEVNQPIIKDEEYEAKPNINAVAEPQVRAPNQRRFKKPYHRHTQHQIKEMESYFIECPYPDEDQRKELALELGLEPLQVKFWFQNKRTQRKAQYEHRENLHFASKNKKLLAEQLRLKEAMRNPTCSKCGGPAYVPGGMSCEAQRLRMENARLREEIGMMSALAENFTGKPIPAGEPSPPMDEDKAAEDVEEVVGETMWNDDN